MEQGWVHVVYGYPYESYIYNICTMCTCVRELFFILVQLIYFSQKGVIFNLNKKQYKFFDGTIYA